MLYATEIKHFVLTDVQKNGEYIEKKEAQGMRVDMSEIDECYDDDEEQGIGLFM